MTRPGNLPHIEWIDLKGDGIMHECAVMKRDGLGNTFFFEVGPLDHIDKRRLVRILGNRNAKSFPLWDLMSQITLNNGVNALEYFHQLVKVITAAGIVMNPREGVVGTGKVDTLSKEERKAHEDSKREAVETAASAAADAATRLVQAQVKVRAQTPAKKPIVE